MYQSFPPYHSTPMYKGTYFTIPHRIITYDDKTQIYVEDIYHLMFEKQLLLQMIFSNDPLMADSLTHRNSGMYLTDKFSKSVHSINRAFTATTKPTFLG